MDTTPTTAITDYLGDFAADLTDERKADLVRVAGRIGELYPADVLDDAEPGREALSGATMAALGDATVESLAAELRGARAALERARQRLAGAMLWEQMALGTSDYKLAARSQQARGTVRRALGL